MASFEEGLGRIMFVAGALEHERPFLGPLYKFLTMHPRDSVRRVPSYVALYSGTCPPRSSRTVTIYAEQGILQQNAYQGIHGVPFGFPRDIQGRFSLDFREG